MVTLRVQVQTLVTLAVGGGGGGVEPSGSITITENGIYNVTTRIQVGADTT